MLGVFYFPKGTTWEELVPERDAVCSSALAFASSGEQISLYSPSPVQHPNPHARRILKHTTKHATIAHRPAANNYPYVLHFKRHNYSSYLQALLNRISPPSMHIPAPPVQTHIPSLSVWGGGHFSDLAPPLSIQLARCYSDECQPKAFHTCTQLGGVEEGIRSCSAWNHFSSLAAHPRSLCDSGLGPDKGVTMNVSDSGQRFAVRCVWINYFNIDFSEWTNIC